MRRGEESRHCCPISARGAQPWILQSVRQDESAASLSCRALWTGRTPMRAASRRIHGGPGRSRSSAVSDLGCLAACKERDIPWGTDELALQMHSVRPPVHLHHPASSWPHNACGEVSISRLRRAWQRYATRLIHQTMLRSARRS